MAVADLKDDGEFGNMTLDLKDDGEFGKMTADSEAQHLDLKGNSEFGNFFFFFKGVLH